MTTVDRLLLGRWITDVPAEYMQTSEVTELVFYDDGQLEYIIRSGTIAQRFFMQYKSGNGYLHFTHVDTLNSIPFDITCKDKVAFKLRLQLKHYPCTYRRHFEDVGISKKPQERAGVSYRLKTIFGRWRELRSLFLS